MDMLLLPAVNYSSRLSPPPFPSAISPQSWYSRPLKSSYFEVYTDTKYVWYNSFSFHAATKPFHAKITQNITLCTVHTQKVRNVYDYCEVLLFSLNKTTYIYTSQHQYICYRKHSFKIRPNSQRKTHRGCKLSIPFWQEGLSCKLWKCAQYIHKTYKTKQHWKTANTHHNINMFTTGNTHLKYRKHRVHSAAHKLKIRSSRLVLTTAGTDLDSTDRAAMGELKIAQPVSR